MYHGERFNGYSHLVGTLLALSGAVVLVVSGALRADVWKVVSFSIYGASLVLLYAISTLYHSTRGRPKRFFRQLDHNAIYLLIAGTYTPFTLVTLRGPWGWTLFGIVWGLAALGMLQEVLLGKKTRIISLSIYVLMGWIALVAVVPLMDALSPAGFAWVALGGVIYTVGIVFYLFDERFTHWHGIWHLFVIGGSALHYFAILKYVAWAD
ncbi:MAG: hemolysin III family protein [Betaproteobacteria bacterium]|nr:hemolysin III family protein [Betaproteobacteria bacterium]